MGEEKKFKTLEELADFHMQRIHLSLLQDGVRGFKLAIFQAMEHAIRWDRDDS